MSSYFVVARNDLSQPEAVSALEDFRKASIKGLRIVQDHSFVMVVEIDDQNAMNEAARVSAGRLIFEEERPLYAQDPSP